MKCVWVVDNALLERHDEGFGFPRIDEAAKALGHDVYVTKYIPFSDSPQEFETANDWLMGRAKAVPHIFYGSVEWLNQIERCGWFKQRGYIPGAYFKKEALKYSNYSSRPEFGDLMLNDDYLILPFGEIKRRLDWDIHQGLRPPYFKSPKMFIRPDVVTKSFAGRVIDFASEEEKPESLNQYEKISDEELCVVATEKKIIGEYRHIICRNELIAQSQYRRDGKIDIRIDVEPECQRLAKFVSREEYQPDTVYTLDTAMTEDGPRIVEFNAFSCSGLYASDTMRIVRDVSFAATIEFLGDDI